MKDSRYRFERLTAAKCTAKEVTVVTHLYQTFLMHDKSLPSATDIKLTCRHNSVFVARSREERGEPIIGIIVLTTSYLLNGMNARIEFPIIQLGYEIISKTLLDVAIQFARKQGINRIEVPHRVLGVRWQHRLALRELGFCPIGSHISELVL